MKKFSLFACAALAAFLARADVTVELWPEGQIPDFQTGQKDQHHIVWCNPPATANDKKPCMIMISGGSYTSLADLNVITQQWVPKLTALGIQCVILYYRTPRPEGLPIYQSAWEDAQRAVRLVRSQAATYGIDPNRIGAMGMSAGSHLSTLLATSSQTNVYDRVDAIDDISAHLNVALVHSIAYGMTDGLTGQNSSRGFGAELDSVFQFDEKTCPMCFTHGEMDGYSAMSSTHVWRGVRAKGVMAELHTYADKLHEPLGFDRHVEFLRKLGWVGETQAAESPLVRWPDESARASVVTEPLYPDGAAGGPVVEWHLPKNYTTASVQMILVGPGAASEPITTAITAARRYLNSTGMAVVTAQIRAESAFDDAKAAVTLVRAEAESRGLNPSYVGVMAYGTDVTNVIRLAKAGKTSAYRPKWAVSVSPRNLDVILDDTSFKFSDQCAPTLLLHAENDSVSPLESVEMWEKMKHEWLHSSLHTIAGDNEGFVASAVPGTGGYTYLSRIREFLSDKKYLAAWTPPEEGEEEEEDDPDPEDPGDPEPEITYSPWFDVGFTNAAFIAGSDWIAQSVDPAGGAFTAADGVESTLVKSAGSAYVEFVPGKEGSIAYDPSSPSDSGKTVILRGRAKVESRAELPMLDANAKAGLCFIAGVPYGYANGAWTQIASTKFTERTWTDYTTEFEFAGEGAPRVRYTVGSAVGEWVALKPSAANVLRVRFLGGAFGDFKGEYSHVAEDPSDKGAFILVE